MIPKYSTVRLGACLRAAAISAVLVFPGAAFAVTADSADDVCAIDADPCTVTEPVEVVAGSRLDFGTRAVHVSGSGRFDFGGGTASVLCGPFEASTMGNAIVAKGPIPPGQIGVGRIRVEARRACSGQSGDLPCVLEADCQPGPCNARRCSGKPSTICTDDSGCQLGVCGSTGRCSNLPRPFCSTNADCDLGSCAAQLTCRGRNDDPIACAIDTDCDFGACSQGTASIVLGGSVSGLSDRPSSLALMAADSVTISAPIDLSSRLADFDGGGLQVVAGAGDILVSSKLTSRGGKFSTGGLIEFAAAGDIETLGKITVDGGDFDGGSVDYISGGNVRIGASIRASSGAGGGSGGEILVVADGDVVVDGGPQERRTMLTANGHTDAERTAGDGGYVEIDAGGSVLIDERVRMSVNGSAPDGSGGDLYLAALGDLTFDGDVRMTGGVQGDGGTLEVDASGLLAVGETSKMLARGGSSGGDIAFASETELVFAGEANVAAAGRGFGGSVDLLSDEFLSFSGSLSSKGVAGGGMVIDGCRVLIEESARIRNKATDGSCSVFAGETMQFLAGSTMLTPGGINTLTYRTADKPPLLAGTISPDPILVVDEFLDGCPVCGNAEIDEEEECDDGNIVPGDGCDEDCYLE